MDINAIGATTVVTHVVMFIVGLLLITKTEAVVENTLKNEVLKPQRTQKQQEKLEKDLKIIARVGGWFFLIVSIVSMLLILFYPWPEM